MASFVDWGTAWGTAWGTSNPGAMQGAASFAFGGSATLTTDTIAGLMQANQQQRQPSWPLESAESWWLWLHGRLC